MTKKEQLSWTLTNLWYIILSETTNYFLVMSRQEENEWERTFTRNSMKKYTAAQLEVEIANARAFCIAHKFFKEA